jgi:hypothetical protein
MHPRRKQGQHLVQQLSAMMACDASKPVFLMPHEPTSQRKKAVVYVYEKKKYVNCVRFKQKSERSMCFAERNQNDMFMI